MPNPKYGNTSLDKLYLVRVQGGLDGVKADGDDLLITRNHKGINEDSMRNTIHFTLNGVVSNHAYSQFNDLYVFVSPFEKTAEHNKGLLAGLNPSDTFFHQDINDSLRLYKPTLIAPSGADIPEHILNSDINVVRYDAPDEINAETLQATRNKAVGSVLKEFGAPENAVGMWGWSDSKATPTDQERNQILENLGYEPKKISKVHTGSPESNIEGLIGSYVYHHNSILSGEKLDTLETGLQIPHTEQIVKVQQAILDEISNIPNGDIQTKLTNRFAKISEKYQEKLSNYQIQNDEQFGMVNDFSGDGLEMQNDEQFGVVNDFSGDGLEMQNDEQFGVVNDFSGDGLEIQNDEQFGVVNDFSGDGLEFTGFVSETPTDQPTPPPLPDSMDLDAAYVQEVDGPPNLSFDGFYDPNVLQEPPITPYNQEAAPMSQTSVNPNESVFLGDSVDLNTYTAQYLLHPKRTIDEIHQAIGMISTAPSDQVQAHFGAWTKQQINDLNTILTNDARQNFNQIVNDKNTDKPVTEQHFTTLSGGWYNTANGSDAALKGLDASAFARVPIVEFSTIDPKTRGLQTATRFALTATNPSHPHVNQFIKSRADLVSSKSTEIDNLNKKKLQELSDQIASAENNGIYLGLEKNGLPIKSALNIVQHPTIVGRAEEVKLGEENSLTVAENGLYLQETPKDVFGIRSLDPQNPVPFSDLEAAENDRKRDFAIGMEEGSDISQPEISNPKDKDDVTAANVNNKDNVTVAKPDDKKVGINKPGNGRNNFNHSPSPENNGVGFTSTNKKPGNNTADLVDDLEEKPKRIQSPRSHTSVPSRKYMLEQLLDMIRALLAGLMKLLANLLRFTFNASKSAYYAGKLGYQKYKKQDTFDTNNQLKKAFSKTVDTLSFDRTSKAKEKRDGKFLAAVGMPNGLGDKTIQQANENKSNELNINQGLGEQKTLANALTAGDIAAEHPVTDKDIENFGTKSELDTMFTTKDGEQFVVVGSSTQEDGKPPSLDVIKLEQTTIVPITRNSREFTHNVIAMPIEEIKEKIDSVSYESKILAPQIVAAIDEQYKNSPQKFFDKYPNEQQLKVDTSLDVLNDRIGRILKDKKAGESYAIVGVDTFINKDGSNDFKYKAVKMGDNIPGNLNYLRDTEIQTVSPSFFKSDKAVAVDTLDPNLKERLVDLQANGIEIHKNGMGLDISDIKKLGDTLIEMSNRGLHQLTGQEKFKLTDQIKSLAQKHEPIALKDNIIKFDPSSLAEKLNEKGQQHLNDVFLSKNIDPLDPLVQNTINAKMGSFFGKQSRSVVEPESPPTDQSAFSFDYIGVEFKPPTLTDNITQFNLDSGTAIDDYQQQPYLDVDHDINAENTAFILSKDNTVPYEKVPLFVGPIQEVQTLDDIHVNKQENDFQIYVAPDHSIYFPGVHTGYTADEIPNFKPKDALNKQFNNDIWMDAPRGSLEDTVDPIGPGIILDIQQEDLLIEKPVITDATFDQLLKEFNELYPVNVGLPTYTSALQETSDVDWSQKALTINLVEELGYTFKPTQEYIVETAIEEVQTLIENDKKEILKQIGSQVQTSDNTLDHDVVQYTVEQQVNIQKRMEKSPNSLITGESLPIQLPLSMSELSSMPTKGHADLLVSIRDDDFSQQMQLKALSTFANRNPDAKSLDASEVKAVTDHVRLSDAAHLIRLHRDEQNSQNYKQSALFAPGLRSLNGVEGDQNLMSRRNRYEPFDLLKERIIHELEASDNHPSTISFCEDLIQKRITNEINKLARGCEAVGLQLNKSFKQSVAMEQSINFKDTIRSQFPDTDIKINDLVTNKTTGEKLTVVGRRLDDITSDSGVVSQEERILVARSSALGLIGNVSGVSPSQIELREKAGGRLSDRQIENFERLNSADLNGLNIGSNQTKLDLTYNDQLHIAKDNILSMLQNPQAHPDDSLACELQSMRDSLNTLRDRFLSVQREVLKNPVVATFVDNVEDHLRKVNINPNIVSNMIQTQNEQGALVNFDRVINMDALNTIREMQPTNKMDVGGFYQQTDFAKVLIDAKDNQLNAQIAELGRLSKDIANTMGSIDEIRNDMVDRLLNEDHNLSGNFTKEDINYLHQQVTNDTLTTRESLPVILGSMAQYSEVANNIEAKTYAQEYVSDEQLVSDGNSKFAAFLGKISSMFKRNDSDVQSQLDDKSQEIQVANNPIEVKVKVEKVQTQDNNNSLSM